MLVRSTSETDAVNGFFALERDAHTLPELLVEGHASSTLLNHYVLLHDASVRPLSLPGVVWWAELVPGSVAAVGCVRVQ
jgi:hypothetical protein